MSVNVKLVIAGVTGAGVTTFIDSLSDRPIITNPTSDWGQVTVDEHLQITLLGIGSQAQPHEREIILEGHLGIVFVVDSTQPDTFNAANALLDEIAKLSKQHMIIAANMQDKSNALPPEKLRDFLTISHDTNIMPCIATNKQLVQAVVVELLGAILDDMEDE